jgi:hypothetical protein
MTDDALDPRDELASAHLDGATTPDEAAQVAGDEDLEARVAAFAASREAVRAVGGPVDEARREAAIAAAPPALAADLGPHADLGSLADAARATLASPPTTVPGTPAPTAEPGAEACLAGLRVAAADAGGTIVLEATAVLDDRPVVAAATRQPDGTLVLDVVALDGCAPIASVDL